ncbi:MAG: LytTR family DNA-binding domain-containing protein [Anaerolineales bacterium]
MIQTADEEFLIEDSLVNLEKEFGDRFLRIHRNALVATDRILGVEKNPTGSWQVNLRDTDRKLDVSRRHTASVRRWVRNRRTA